VVEKMVEFFNEMLCSFIDAIPNPVFYKDINGLYIDGNKSFEDFIGITKNNFINKSDYKLFEEEIAKEFDFMDNELLKKQGQCIYNTTIKNQNGNKCNAVFKKMTCFNKNKEIAGVIGIIILKSCDNSLLDYIDNTPTAIFLFNEEKINYCNKKIELLLGYKKEEILSLSLSDLIMEKDINIFKNNITRLKTNEINYFVCKLNFLTKTRNNLFIEFRVNEVFVNNEKYFLGELINISEHTKYEEQIKQISLYDSLTGLPNKKLFDQCLEQLIIRSKYENFKIAVMFIDLDRFKMINDTLGHNFGDVLLQETAKRLKSCVRKNNMIARYGGDEFIILLENINYDEIEKVAQRIINSFKNLFIINDTEIYISPSIGISIYPDDADDSHALIKNADMAMYLAKDQGKNNFQFYKKELSKNLDRKATLESCLRKALQKDEFILHYQPQVDLNSGKIIGMEALIRWRHPELGMISPVEFIPLAEETGLIVSIGEWVLRTACKQNKLWQDEGFPKMRIAVNISAVQFQNENFLNSVNNILEETKLKPEYLELEITESIMHNIKELKNILIELKKIGVQISIDDFGTGYSTLSILKNLPINKLKIDQLFLDDILINNSTVELMKTIIDMGHNLNFYVIAEGIEDKNQVSFLRQNKCNIGQGYLFSRPLPVENLRKTLTTSYEF
jgi:diguanylate cyclase (GGDEF)-like protein/PAS domain S-box-containing protein